MLRPKSKPCHLSAAGELRPCAAYSDPSVRESPVFPNRKLRECAAFACSCEDGRPGNPVPSHSLSDTIFFYTDIGRTRPDLFSFRVKTFSRQSAAPRLIASPFFNTSFFIFGARKARQVSKQRNPYFRRAQQPAGGSPFLRHLSLFFHGNSFSRSGRGNHRPSLSVLPSLREHGLSVRMSQSLLTFSGGVRPAAVCGIQGLRPSFFRLYEQFFIIH